MKASATIFGHYVFKKQKGAKEKARVIPVHVLRLRLNAERAKPYPTIYRKQA